MVDSKQGGFLESGASVVRVDGAPIDPRPRWVTDLEMGLGGAVRQGDLYLVRVPEVPFGWRRQLGRQLAPGDSPGSRHVAVGAVVLWVAQDTSDPLVGPVVAAPERFEVQHPEHAALSLPAGAYQVRYQRRYHPGEEEIQAFD